MRGSMKSTAVAARAAAIERSPRALRLLVGRSVVFGGSGSAFINRDSGAASCCQAGGTAFGGIFPAWQARKRKDMICLRP